MQQPSNSTQPGMVQEVLASMGAPIWIDGVQHGWNDGGPITGQMDFTAVSHLDALTFLPFCVLSL
jgi:hypothetical protein